MKRTTGSAIVNIIYFLKYKLSGDGKEFVEALCIIFAVSKLYSSSILKISQIK